MKGTPDHATRIVDVAQYLKGGTMSKLDRFEYNNGIFYENGKRLTEEEQRKIPMYFRAVLREMEGEQMETIEDSFFYKAQERQEMKENKGTPAHAARIADQARLEARLEWQQTPAQAWQATGKAEGQDFLIVELPGPAWGLITVEHDDEIMGRAFPTLAEAQAEALDMEALGLAFRMGADEGIVNDWDISDVFDGKAIDNVIQLDKARKSGQGPK
jgi:hypothetical protein